jgi:hypothetical protein
MFAIASGATIIICAAVLAIEIIPGVREIYGFPFCVIEIGLLDAGDVLADEMPAFV